MTFRKKSFGTYTLLMLLNVLIATAAQAQFHFGQNPWTSIHNPYCAVPTYAVPNEPRRGGINLDTYGRYYITVDHRLQAHQNTLLATLAHECGHVHHRHGLHVHHSALAGMELDADCFAARKLVQQQHWAVLEALRRFVGACGDWPSGPPGYPSCNQRLERINACAGGPVLPILPSPPRLAISR